MDLSWSGLDLAVATLLAPLAIWILLTGVDDIFIDIVGLVASARRKASTTRPSRASLLSETQKPIAILIPLWREAGVIGRMVQQNTASILYSDYHMFVGCYPNDEPTLTEVRALEAKYPHVHLAVCPHNGPTSKADCLNWIFQNLVAYEQSHVMRFEILVTHDAEDVIHSDALHWINHYADDYEMIQTPVLPLPTPITKWTHGVYIDEFAEYQTRDMPARQTMGAFVPSNGVGTGFRRDAMDALAAAEDNRVFEPVCLTEDYENGLRLRLRGARQLFLPLQGEGMATREYFPDTPRSAIRQRTRWVTGIALQTWDRHGWKGGIVQKYWLWRDRKGLIGNPASLLANVLFVYGAGRWMLGGTVVGTFDAPVLRASVFLAVYRLVYRAICTGRIFGIRFAFGVPVRVVVANYINSAATFIALIRFFTAKVKGIPLVWVKTEHAYPRQFALAKQAARLGELLVANGYVTQADVSRALETKPAHLRLGEYLVACGHLNEDDLYGVLSLQQAVPQTRIEPHEVRLPVARLLPARVATELNLIPFKVDVGRLLVAGPELPTMENRETLRRFTSLEVEFHLVTPANYRELVNELLRA